VAPLRGHRLEYLPGPGCCCLEMEAEIAAKDLRIPLVPSSAVVVYERDAGLFGDVGERDRRPVGRIVLVLRSSGVGSEKKRRDNCDPEPDTTHRGCESWHKCRREPGRPFNVVPMNHEWRPLQRHSTSIGDRMQARKGIVKLSRVVLSDAQHAPGNVGGKQT